MALMALSSTLIQVFNSLPQIGSTSTRKRRPRRQFPCKIPHVVLELHDDNDDKINTAADSKSELKATKEASGSSDEPAATSNLPCIDDLRGSTLARFYMKCLKHAGAKCSKRCPKCGQIIRSCTINTTS